MLDTDKTYNQTQTSLTKTWLIGEIIFLDISDC